MLVIGIGEKKTPNPFIVACDKFIYIEIIAAKISSKETNKTTSAATPAPKNEIDSMDQEFIQLVRSSIEDLEDEDGWASLAAVGGLINKKKPDFDPRNYGFSKLTPLIKSLKAYVEVDEREVGNTHIKHIYVRNRKSQAPLKNKR